MPGSPSSASTASPESSANAGKPDAAAAARALMSAFSAKLVPVSSGSAKPSSPADTASIPYGMSSSRISRSLPGLWLAITSRPEIGRCAPAALSVTVRDSITTGSPVKGFCPTPAASGYCGPGCRGGDTKKCRSHHRYLLQIDQLHHALLGERQQVEELLLGERSFLGRALHLDDPSIAGHDEIGVGVGFGVLGIVEVEHRRAVGNAAGDGGHVVAQRLGLEHVARLHPGDATVQRHPGAGNGRRARSAIGLDHVAIDRDLPLAECGQIENRAQAASDQALNLDRAAALLAGRRLAAGPFRCCARQHAVLGGDPAARLPFYAGAPAALERR